MPGPGAELVLGPMLFGVLLSIGLYGVMTAQMFAYYQRFPNDFRWIRLFMLYLFLAETAVVVAEVGIIYQPLIQEFGSPLALQNRPACTSFRSPYGGLRFRLVCLHAKLADSLLIILVSTPIQLFTAWRIKVITHSYILPSIISLFAIASFASGLVLSANVFAHAHFRDFPAFATEAITWLVATAACDVLVAVGMTHALLTRRTGFGGVDGQINRIVRMTIETGAVTAVAAIADILLASFVPGTTNFIVDFPLSMLYTCSVLAMLNSRTPRSGKNSSSSSGPQMLPSPATSRTGAGGAARWHTQLAPTMHLSRSPRPTVRRVTAGYTSPGPTLDIARSPESAEWPWYGMTSANKPADAFAMQPLARESAPAGPQKVAVPVPRPAEPHFF
ncbi:hypothetical protein MIND_01287500 [Mycena indigotica]|uniref:DUF6534 domain-containing protein n=1 Tax=Mycena indigotica TaxID=2126181 RepID=A0A8H6S2U8_9AGAR|nr:uncharacterized protein MIND_01287500 [Mycena indigotica]KAF7291427.1 hypothetical protein MIND_01287500 [Mycena indigotica]